MSHYGVIFGGKCYCKLNAVDDGLIPVSPETECNFNGPCDNCPKKKNTGIDDIIKNLDNNGWSHAAHVIENLREENKLLKAERNSWFKGRCISCWQATMRLKADHDMYKKMAENFEETIRKFINR